MKSRKERNSGKEWGTKKEEKIRNHYRREEKQRGEQKTKEDCRKMAQDRPNKSEGCLKMSQDGLRMAQDGPKMAPKRPALWGKGSRREASEIFKSRLPNA